MNRLRGQTGLIMHSYYTEVDSQTHHDMSKDIHPPSLPQKNPIKIAPKPLLHCNSAANHK